MNKKVLLMILRILSLTKGTTGAENVIDPQDSMFFQPTPTVEMQLASSSWCPETPVSP